MDDHLQQVAQAFSQKAGPYDSFGESHLNLARMRRKVYAHVQRWLRPGDRILELNAGTGIDAAYFAGQGYAVHATDIAPGMLAAAAEKAASPGLRGRLTVQACSFTELSQVDGAPYDYLFSNFGGLNCAADLGIVARQVPRVLRPGGRLDLGDHAAGLSLGPGAGAAGRVSATPSAGCAAAARWPTWRGCASG